MQYLKEEVRQKIFDAAKEEFTHNGYSEASIRTIAKTAGISSGNVYRYFDSKEVLFDAIVGDVYKNLMQRLYEIEVTLIRSPQKDKEHLDCLKQVDLLLLDLFEIHGQELMILLFKSNGSKYEKLKKELIDLIERFLLETHDFTARYPQLEDQNFLLARAIASSLVEATCTLLESSRSGQEIRLLLNEFLQIHSLGIKSFFTATA